LAELLVATGRTLHRRETSGIGKGADLTFSPHETLEVLRLLGSLELLAGEVKIELGQMLLDLLPKRKLEAVRPAVIWVLGRLGAREPAYGPLNTRVPAADRAAWIEQPFESKLADVMIQFAFVNLSRRTGDRFRDIDEALRQQVVSWLKQCSAGDHALSLVSDGGWLDPEDANRVFGEALPKGLRLR